MHHHTMKIQLYTRSWSENIWTFYLYQVSFFKFYIFHMSMTNSRNKKQKMGKSELKHCGCGLVGGYLGVLSQLHFFKGVVLMYSKVLRGMYRGQSSMLQENGSITYNIEKFKVFALNVVFLVDLF